MILIVTVVCPVEGDFDFSVFGVGDERISKVAIIFGVFAVVVGLGLLLLLCFIDCQKLCSLLKTIRIVTVAFVGERHFFFAVVIKRGYWI